MDETNTENWRNPQPQQRLIESRPIGIQGMTCDKCVATVDNALRNVKGVIDVKVDRQAALATVTFDRAQTDIPALHDALLAQGYTPKGPDSNAGE